MKLLRKWSICLLAMMVLLSGTVFAQTGAQDAGTGASSLKMNFPDVSENHWALKHIRKLALQGVISGYDTGEFRPEAPVTQEQVIVMAIGAMGLSDEVDREATVVLPFAVTDYARPYVALALEKGLINAQEETALLSGENTTNWGTKEASRQWVTKIIVRAIGKEEQAQDSMEPTAFNDNEDIAAWALGYVNVAVDLGIVSGFDGNVFKPEENVTRAQMATFFSLSEPYMENPPSERVVRGTLVSLDESSVTILDSQGQTKTYALAEEAAFYSAKEHFKEVDPASFEPYQEVYVIQSGGQAYYVERLDDEARIETSEGILTDIDIADMEIYLLEKGELKNYSLASNVTVKDNDGIGMSLSALTKNSKIQIKKSVSAEQAKIVEIVLLEVAVNKTTEGIIENIDTAKRLLSFKETDGEEAEAYLISETPTIKYGETYLPSFSELNVGDRVKLVIEDSVIKSIELLGRSSKAVERGKISIIDTEKRTLVIQKADSSLGAFRISDDVEISIKGLSWASLNDLEPGDQVELEVADNSVVTKITAVKELPAFIKAKIVSYDSNTGLLAYIDSSGNGGAKFITDATRIKYNKTTVSRDKFGQYFLKDTPVRIEVSGSNIVTIELDNQAKGIITNITETSISLREDDGLTYTYKMDEPTIIIYDDSTNSWKDLDVGDRVEITLSSDRDEAETIRLVQTMILRAYIVDVEDKEILFLDEEGGTEELEIDKTVPITMAGSDAMDLSDIPLHEPLAVTLTGDRVDAIEILTVKRGIITSVNDGDKTIRLKPYGKTSAETVQLKDGFQIYEGRNVFTNTNKLDADDRVEIAADSSGKQYVIILAGKKMHFDSYDEKEGKVYLRDKIWNNSGLAYPLDKQAYLHDGSKPLDLKSLNDNYELLVYMAGKKIVEISKP